MQSTIHALLHTLQQLKVYLALLSGHQAPHIMGIRLASRSLTSCISSTRSACLICSCCHCYACVACSHMMLDTMGLVTLSVKSCSVTYLYSVKLDLG